MSVHFFCCQHHVSPHQTIGLSWGGGSWILYVLAYLLSSMAVQRDNFVCFCKSRKNGSAHSLPHSLFAVHRRVYEHTALCNCLISISHTVRQSVKSACQSASNQCCYYFFFFWFFYCFVLKIKFIFNVCLYANQM